MCVCLGCLQRKGSRNPGVAKKKGEPGFKVWFDVLVKKRYCYFSPKRGVEIKPLTSSILIIIIQF
jgi:hypothetical protein